MTRSEAREIAFKTIYSKFFIHDEEEVEVENQEDLKFTAEILKNFAAHYEEVNSIISGALKGYTIERVYKIDLAILTLAVIELKFIKDTPKEVIINEAVELAKKYSTEKSPKFVNGVLADIVK